jgi:hypothetical protein
MTDYGVSDGAKHLTQRGTVIPAAAGIQAHDGINRTF